VEVITAEARVKFTLSTAISQEGQDCILKEHDILHRLNRNSGFSFLPETYGIRKMTCHTAQGKTVEMVILAAQWFEDYHEWHIAVDPADDTRKIQIWDLKRGPRYASAGEASIIIGECSKILALYYDFENCNHIGAWHHAAGDFIVNCPQGGKPKVKLTTVRKYAPLMAAFSGRDVDPIIAFIYFLLDTTVRMRLDRLDGVGEMVWLDDFVVAATVKGFFDGLRELEIKEDGVKKVLAADLLKLMKSFARAEIKRVFEPLSARYNDENTDEAAVIDIHLDDHISFLFQALQDFH